MAIALLMRFPGDGRDALALYDQANEKMHTMGDVPDGLIFHWAAKAENGDLRVTDVWESREKFDRFFRERLGPTIGQLELSKPDVEELQVYNTIGQGAPSRA